MSLDCGRVALLGGNQPAGRQLRTGGLFQGFHDNEGGERCSDDAAAKGRVSQMVVELGLSPAMAFMTAARMRGGVSTGSRANSSGISLRSQAFTCRANRRSLLISVSASSRSLARRLQRVNSAASYLRSSGLAIETLLQTHQTGSQQRFDRRGGLLVLGGGFIARPALLIG